MSTISKITQQSEIYSAEFADDGTEDHITMIKDGYETRIIIKSLDFRLCSKYEHFVLADTFLHLAKILNPDLDILPTYHP